MARMLFVLHAHVALPVPMPTVWNILSKRDAAAVFTRGFKVVVGTREGVGSWLSLGARRNLNELKFT